MFCLDPQGCRCRSNPGLKLANAFGVNRMLDLENAYCAGALQLQIVKTRNGRIRIV